MRCSTTAILISLSFMLCIGCGGASNAGSTPTSAWAGTYAGNLNFNGCPSQNPCGGDSITLIIGQPYNSPEFSSSMTLSGTDYTSGAAIAGNGYTLDVSPAGPATGVSATATFTTSLEINSFFVSATGPVPTGNALGLIQTLSIYNCPGPAQGGTCGGKGTYLGTLTRQ